MNLVYSQVLLLSLCNKKVCFFWQKELFLLKEQEPFKRQWLKPGQIWMHFNVILEPGGWLSCQTLLLTILILTTLNIQQLKFQTTGFMMRTAHEGVTCKPLLLPPAPIPPSFCIKKEKKNNGRPKHHPHNHLLPKSISCLTFTTP